MAGPRGVADAKFVGHTCASAPLSTRIRAFRPLDTITANIRTSLRSRQMNGFESLLQLLGLLQLGGLLLWSFFCFGHWAFLCLHLPPTLASRTGIICPRVFLSLLTFLLAFPFLALLTLSPRAFHLPDIHRRRSVRGRVPPRIVKGSLCQPPLSHVSAQGLVILTVFQGNQFQEITVGCWRVFPSQSPLGPLAGGLHLRHCCSVQRLSPTKRACHRVPRCTSFAMWHVG